MIDEKTRTKEVEECEHDALPEGWAWTTLGAVRHDERQGIDPRRHPDVPFELYSVPSFDDGVPELVYGKYIGSSKQIVQPGTVLLCKINPRINRVWVVGSYSSHQKIASTEWIPFMQVQGIEPKYLAYYMRQEQLRDFLAMNASGVGGSLMRVKGSTLADYSFPLAPLSEQHRIVAKIEELFTQVDAGVAALKRIQANLKRYRAAVLKAACEGRLVPQDPSDEPASQLLERILQERRARWEADQRAKGVKSAKAKYEEPAPPDVGSLPELPEGWVWSTIEQLSEVVRGASPRPAGDPKYFGGSIPWITVGSLTADEGPYLTEVSAFVTKAGRLASRHIEADTLLLTNSGATLGVPKITKIGGCINDGSVALLNVDYPLKLYLYYFLASITKQLRRINQGAAQPNLNTTIVKAIDVALPPLPEQHRIVAEVERRLSVVQELEATVEANLKRAERLRQSILKRAFEGKLVEQDPSDEPAWALLEKIRGVKARAARDALSPGTAVQGVTAGLPRKVDALVPEEPRSADQHLFVQQRLPLGRED